MPSAHDKYAPEYDQQVQAYHCHIADVLFGLCYETVMPGEKLLDIGIGTGISSILFKKAGLQVYGIDGSPDMLSICRQKGVAEDLVEQDLLNLPWPYPNGSFHHIISCGVFHFIGDLEGIFSEIQRIQMRNGIFAFTIKKDMTGGDPPAPYHQQMEDGIPVFSHPIAAIDSLLTKFNYIKRKEITSYVGETPFIAISAQKG